MQDKEIDYRGIGFKCGLEIHQQLDTGKLFCRCSSGAFSDGSPDFRVARRLRTTAGETGIVDIAARHEEKKAKRFVYQFFRENCCLVELDEEPPHSINPEALGIAVKVALLLNMKLVDEMQVMRKIVIDGSNTTGFQRTALLAYDGFIETSRGRVGIPLLSIEEESAQIVRRTETEDEYNLSRLGIPLIEIDTAPDIIDAEHAKESAEKLGMVLRSVNGMKRGIGTIRQDVNLSVRNGRRVEIKGFQELKSIPKIIEYEVKRHLKIMAEGREIEEEVRKAEPDMTTSFLRPMASADRMYPETDIPPVIIHAENVELPELGEAKIARYMKDFEISGEIASLAVRKKIPLDNFARKYKNVKPSTVAEIFLSMPKEARKKYDAEIFPEKHAEEVIEKLNNHEIAKNSVLELLIALAKGQKIDYSTYKPVDDSEIAAQIKQIVDENPGKNQGALMGMAMASLKGRADGKKVAEILGKLMAGK